MALKIVVGPQLPPDSTGKITGAFTAVAYDGTTVYIPATAFVNADGVEIGDQLLRSATERNDLLYKIAMTLGLILNELSGGNIDAEDLLATLSAT